MDIENRNIILILLILALFTGATIELGEGTTSIGIILLIAAAILMSKIKITDTYGLKRNRNYITVGSLIIISDITYNYINQNGIGTVDSMVFFMGISLIAMGTNKKDITPMGELGLYISSIFTAFYLIFYSAFGYFNIDFIHLFDHYFVLIPTVDLIGFFGIPIEIIATETVILYGAEPMTIVIGGPCSGLYSMFLLVGIVAGYSRMEKMDTKKSFQLLGFAILVAYIANLVRVVILYVTAYLYGMDVMMMVHTHIGWIIFALTAGGIMFIMNRK
jgi:archaeosortase C (PEF-CTERM variant)